MTKKFPKILDDLILKTLAFLTTLIAVRRSRSQTGTPPETQEISSPPASPSALPESAPADAKGKSRGKTVKPRVKRSLSAKAKKLVKAFVKNPDLTLREAGEKAGYKYAPAVSAHRALNSPDVQFAFREAMAKHKSFQHKALLDKLSEGLNAMTKKYFAHEGEVVDEREDVDFSARYSYLALAAKLGGLEPNRMEHTGANGKDLFPPAVATPDFSWMTKEQLDLLLSLKPEEVEKIKMDRASKIVETQVAPETKNEA